MPTPSFSFQLQALDQQGHIRVDVLARNLPQKFLGTAFDLHMDTQGWKYEKYELGPLFTEPHNVLSLATQKNNPDRVIFGVTLKQGKSIQVLEGKIASFYITLPVSRFSEEAMNTPLEIHFDHGVLSTYENARMDVRDVKWSDGAFHVAHVMAGIQTLSSSGDMDSSEPISYDEGMQTAVGNQSAPEHMDGVQTGQTLEDSPEWTQDETGLQNFSPGQGQTSVFHGNFTDFLHAATGDFSLFLWFLAGIFFTVLAFIVVQQFLRKKISGQKI